MSWNDVDAAKTIESGPLRGGSMTGNSPDATRSGGSLTSVTRNGTNLTGASWT